jgi:hypothetical protein
MKSANVDGDPELQLFVERREIAYSKALWHSRPNRRRGDRLVVEREEFLEKQV